MKYYFVATPNKTELNTLYIERPKNILCSFYHWGVKRKKNIKDWLKEMNELYFEDTIKEYEKEYYWRKRSNKFAELNQLTSQIDDVEEFDDTEYNYLFDEYYNPTIILDSGAYSAYNSNAKINLGDYINYIDKNKEVIDYYINLDIIGNPEKTYENQLKMEDKGYKPIPVFHFNNKEKWLKKYIKKGHEYICLGGASQKGSKKVIEWVNYLNHNYPEVDFHLLGKGQKEILENVKVKSCDCSTYIYDSIRYYSKIKDKCKDRSCSTIKLEKQIEVMSKIKNESITPKFDKNVQMRLMI